MNRRYTYVHLVLLLPLMAVTAAAQPAGSPWPRHVIDDSSDGADGVKLGDINGDGLPDIATGWEEGGLSRVYLQPSPATVRGPWPSVTVGVTPDCEDAVFADLDRDGHLDVLSACEGGTRSVFVHWRPEADRDLFKPEAWEQVAIPAVQGMAQWMYATPIRIGGKTAIVLGAKNEGASVGLLRTTGGRDVENWEWQPLSDAGWIMSLKVLDMDGDGYDDILLSDRRGEQRGVRWLRNPGGDGAGEWESVPIGETDAEVMFLSLADLYDDGLDDILVTTKSREIRVLHRLDATGRNWDTEVIPFPEGVGTAKAVVAGDMDGDGDLELVVSCEQSDGDLHGLFGLWRTSGGGWYPRTISGPTGIKYDRIELLDLTGNGFPDVITCEEREGGGGLGVIWYENPWSDPGWDGLSGAS